MYHPFSIADTLKAAWNVLKKNLTTFVVYSILTLFIYGVIDFLTILLVFNDTKVTQLIVGIIQMLIQSYLALSFYKLILTLMDKEYYEFEFREIWPSLKMAFRFILIGFLYVLMVFVFVSIDFLFRKYDAIVFLLEIVEILIFIYLMLRSIFCVCFIADDGSGAMESLRQSFSITKDNFFKTLGMFLIIIAFMFVTLILVVSVKALIQPDADENSYVVKLAFYLWFLIAFPVVQVLIMVTYRKLVYSHLDVDDDVAETN